LAPPYNVQFTTAQSQIQPQTTWNYQLGSSWRSQRWTLSGDLYYINFKNMIGSRSVGGVTEFYNAGGVIYKGIEAETSFYIGKGFSFYGNGSLNRAKNKQTRQWIAEAANGTAGGGIIYSQRGWYGSFIDKWVGDRFGDTGQKQALSPFNQLDFAFGYTLQERPKGMPTLRLKLQVLNLLDSTKINDFAGYSGGSSTPLFYTQLRRSYVATVSIPF
jgi:iron complex outermembrane receptor protein